MSKEYDGPVTSFVPDKEPDRDHGDLEKTVAPHESEGFDEPATLGKGPGLLIAVVIAIFLSLVAYGLFHG